MVTFGIKPTHPETGYGYLQISNDTLDPFGTSLVKKFIEKPDLGIANQMLTAGNYLWNAGIFLFNSQDMIDMFKAHTPETFDLVSQSVDNAFPDLGFLHLLPTLVDAPEYYRYAIMEKGNLVAVPYRSK